MLSSDVLITYFLSFYIACNTELSVIFLNGKKKNKQTNPRKEFCIELDFQTDTARFHHYSLHALMLTWVKVRPQHRTLLFANRMWNKGDMYGEAQHLPLLRCSDHQCILYAPLKHRATGKSSVKTARSLKADNIRALGLRLNHENWDSVFQAKDVDEKVEAFNNILIEALKTCTPQKRLRMPPKRQGMDDTTYQRRI